jgi:plastocyanin
MKKIIGLFMLVIVLAMVTGCTQPAQPAAVTPTVTTATTTEVPAIPTTESTPVPTMEPVPVVTPQSTTVMATTVATVAETPVPVMTPSTKITKIYIRNNSFVPNELMVLPGTGLVWVNDDATVHAIKATITTTDGKRNVFSSGDIMTGSQWSYTFGANEGTYNMIDTYSNATSVIIVKKGESFVGNPTTLPTTAVKI